MSCFDSIFRHNYIHTILPRTIRQLELITRTTVPIDTGVCLTSPEYSEYNRARRVLLTTDPTEIHHYTIDGRPVRYNYNSNDIESGAVFV